MPKKRKNWSGVSGIKVQMFHPLHYSSRSNFRFPLSEIDLIDSQNDTQAASKCLTHITILLLLVNENDI